MVLQKIHKEKNYNKEITKTWLTSQSSCTLVIPRKFAIEYELDKPCHIILEKTPTGILIKKLNFESITNTDTVGLNKDKMGNSLEPGLANTTPSELD
jgi:hypothetical protein